MKKYIKVFLLIIASVVVIYGVGFYWNNLRGLKPAILGAPEDIVDIFSDRDDTGEDLTSDNKASINDTDFPLAIPKGFEISIYAKDLPEARVIVTDRLGNHWVSQTKQGQITLLEVENGQVKSQNAIFRGLDNPHGLTLHPNDPFLLYFAEEDKISRVRLYSEGTPEKIADLPSGGGHFTRTIAFGPDGRLYVSIGSSCNACNEDDPRRAAIYSMNDDGSDLKLFATGLRNSVFFAWHPETREMWVTDNGRDLIGDDIPPDEINIIRAPSADSAGSGQNPIPNFGWPLCYGKNVLDTDFHKGDHVHIRPDCSEPFELPSHIDLQAHSAALGIGFIPESWPQEFRDDAIVAFHGSWNRTEPTGYKLARIKLDVNGNYLGTEDFITGWLQEDNTALGRPVGIFFQQDGSLLVTDDKAGVVYKVMPRK